MSEGFHKGNNIFSFSDEFERPQHISQQQSRSRSDKLRSLQQQQHALLFDASAAVEAVGHDPNLVAMQEEEEEEEGGVYGGGSAGTSNMLSDMFNINYPAPAFGLHFITGQHQQDPAASTTTSTAAVSYLDQQMRPVDSFYATRPDQLVHIINETTPSTASNWISVLGEDSAASGQADHRFFLLNNNNNNNTSGRNIEEDDHHQLHHSSSSDVHHMPAQQTSFLQQQVACQQGHMMSYGPVATLSIFRNSLYARAAQELLEEFCSVSRGHFFKGATRTNSSMMNPSNIRGGAAAASSSSSKEITPLSTADRFESQRKKSKLISMLEEVERRYNQYREQMQMVVNSFESVMGFGAATPYTALAQKAMSRHFRCLKDAIEGQLKRICELLGDKEGTGINNIGSGGLTRVETPKLRLIDQSLRQQRAFHHQLGMMDHDQAWRPQRGLPDRSVTILRAWLFDHFLHPYPSDADKHLLARQTGLSRNQVSNWFINARVRLWKPMVEDMYQKEAKEAEDSQQQQQQQQHIINDQEETNNQSIIMAAAITSQQMSPRAHHINPTFLLHNTPDSASQADCVNLIPRQPQPPENDIMYRRPAAMSGTSAAASQQARTGDLSLTLGLRHAGVNPAAPETSRFGLN